MGPKVHWGLHSRCASQVESQTQREELSVQSQTLRLVYSSSSWRGLNFPPKTVKVNSCQILFSKPKLEYRYEIKERANDEWINQIGSGNTKSYGVQICQHVVMVVASKTESCSEKSRVLAKQDGYLVKGMNRLGCTKIGALLDGLD